MSFVRTSVAPGLCEVIERLRPFLRRNEVEIIGAAAFVIDNAIKDCNVHVDVFARLDEEAFENLMVNAFKSRPPRRNFYESGIRVNFFRVPRVMSMERVSWTFGLNLLMYRMYALKDGKLVIYAEDSTRRDIAARLLRVRERAFVECDRAVYYMRQGFTVKGTFKRFAPPCLSDTRNERLCAALVIQDYWHRKKKLTNECAAGTSGTTSSRYDR